MHYWVPHYNYTSERSVILELSPIEFLLLLMTPPLPISLNLFKKSNTTFCIDKKIENEWDTLYIYNLLHIEIKCCIIFITYKFTILTLINIKTKKVILINVIIFL